MDIHEIPKLLDSQLSPEEKAALNNEIAQTLFGWYFRLDDPRRLWRNADGSPVTWDVAGIDFNLCAHPWIVGQNGEHDRSFDPAFNYHSNLVDWRAIVEAKIRSIS